MNEIPLYRLFYFLWRANKPCKDRYIYLSSTHQMAFQFAFWDKLRLLEELTSSQLHQPGPAPGTHDLR